MKYLDISSFSGHGETSGMLSEVPSSGKVIVGKKFVNTIKKYVPKKWLVELVEY